VKTSSMSSTPSESKTGSVKEGSWTDVDAVESPDEVLSGTSPVLVAGALVGRKGRLKQNIIPNILPSGRGRVVGVRENFWSCLWIFAT